MGLEYTRHSLCISLHYMIVRTISGTDSLKKTKILKLIPTTATERSGRRPAGALLVKKMGPGVSSWQKQRLNSLSSIA